MVEGVVLSKVYFGMELYQIKKGQSKDRIQKSEAGRKKRTEARTCVSTSCVCG
jgi:hypothetical protein